MSNILEFKLGQRKNNPLIKAISYKEHFPGSLNHLFKGYLNYRFGTKYNIVNSVTDAFDRLYTDTCMDLRSEYKGKKESSVIESLVCRQAHLLCIHTVHFLASEWVHSKRQRVNFKLYDRLMERTPDGVPTLTSNVKGNLLKLMPTLQYQRLTLRLKRENTLFLKILTKEYGMVSPNTSSAQTQAEIQAINQDTLEEYANVMLSEVKDLIIEKDNADFLLGLAYKVSEDAKAKEGYVPNLVEVEFAKAEESHQLAYSNAENKFKQALLNNLEKLGLKIK